MEEVHEFWEFLDVLIQHHIILYFFSVLNNTIGFRIFLFFSAKYATSHRFCLTDLLIRIFFFFFFLIILYLHNSLSMVKLSLFCLAQKHCLSWVSVSSTHKVFCRRVRDEIPIPICQFYALVNCGLWGNFHFFDKNL